MRSLAVAALCLVLGACGGRSGIGTPWSRTDGGSSSRLDGGGRQDGVRALDLPWLVDGRRPLDLLARPRDACLPIPAGKVQGSYQGKWKGSWKCPGQPWTSLSGDLLFDLVPGASADAFTVKGSMKGQVDPGFPFKSSITGTMGCTSLNATLPDIIVVGRGVSYQLNGQISGSFQASPSRRFPNGTWSAKQSGGGSKCHASGSWYADRTGP